MSSDYQLEDTLYLPFTTRAFATGIPTALAGTPAIDIYEDVTATPIVTGETLAVSLNSVAGFNMITVTATAATGFEAGKSYTAIIQAGTVGGVSVVGEVVAHFTLDKSAAAKDLANGTDGLGAIKADTAATLADTGTDGVVVASINANAITAAAINADAITEAKIADNAIATEHIATGAITADSIAANAITSSELADGAITAAKLGADAITAAKVAADVHAEAADAVWDEVLTGATHNVVNSAGRRLRQIEAAFVVHTGTAQAGAAGTITLDAGASATDEIYRGDRIIIVGGTGLGEHGLVTAYDGTTKVATMAENWVIAPDATSEFDVVPADADVETWQHNVVTASSTSAKPEVDMFSISDDATAANNAELDYDGTGYAKANSTIGTTTTNTDMRGTDSASTHAAADVARLVNPQTNTGFSNITFEMYDSTNHNPATGLTVTGQRSIDGGAYTNVAGTIAEVGSGTYQFDALAADMNGAMIVFRFSEGASDDTYVHVKTAA